jgi:hypothetical protein
MSKTQDKRKERKIEQLEFMIARRRTQVQMFEQALAIGTKIYEDNKDKLSESETAQLDAMRAENNRLLEEVKTQLLILETEFDELNQVPQA